MREAIGALIALALREGYLDVLETHTHAHALYLWLGFVETGNGRVVRIARATEAWP